MPAVVSLAVLHGEPPQVLVADDLPTLHWLIALEVVARTAPGDLPEATAAEIRQSLLDERWGDAVEAWVLTTDARLDVYASWDLFQAADVALGSAELQFRPLFRG